MADSDKSPWKTLGSEIVHTNSWFKVVKYQVTRPDGKPGEYNVVQTRVHSVFVVPVTPEGDIYLVRLYRYPTQVFSWEVPCGGSEGLPILDAARKELKEETGLTAKTLKEIGTFQELNGICDGWMHVILAGGLEQTGENEQAEEGISQIKKVPFDQVKEMIKTGEITDGASIAAIMQASFYINDFSKFQPNS